MKRRKRGLSTYLCILLRRLGILFNKPKPMKASVLKIQKSISPSGEILNHEDYAFAINHLPHKYITDRDKKSCQYDLRTHTCRCGIKLLDLRENKKCPLQINIHEEQNISE